MESDSPDGGVLTLVPLLASYIINRKKKDRNYFDKGGLFFS